MFYKNVRGEKIIMVLHVDDLAVAASSKELIGELSKTMRKLYDISETEGLKSYTGIHIERLPNGDIKCTQPNYIKSLLEEYDMEDCIPADTPMSVHESEYRNKISIEGKTFRKLLGALMHLLKTRSDISFALSHLSSKANTPTYYDYERLKRVLRYIKGTTTKGLVFRRQSDVNDKNKLKVYCYCDASFASNEDMKSQSGYCFRLGRNNGLYYSKSQKQSTVALSSTEAEHVAASEAVKELAWQRELLKELGFPQIEPTTIYEDNKSTIEIASNLNAQHKRVRHYQVKCEYMKEKLREGTVKFEYMKSENQIADVLTKAMTGSQYSKVCEQL